MGSFTVQVRRISAIEPHNNADILEFAVIDDYRSIVRKGAHQPGDLVAYIPEAAVCPPSVLKTLGLWDEARNKGKCAGEAGTRVKALMLRGKLSQGICYPLIRNLVDRPGAWSKMAVWHLLDEEGAIHEVNEGTDVAAVLGISKYKPEIPAELAGKVYDAGIENVPKFEVEDIKKFPDVFITGEEVFFHEKLHGTFTGYMMLPEKDAHPEHGRFLVFSKGLADDGLAFQLVPENDNAYTKAFREFDLASRLRAFALLLDKLGVVRDQPVFIFGETIGTASKQDLKYGERMAFRVFDMGWGYRSSLTYADSLDVDTYAQILGLTRVPLVYRGPFSKEVLARHTSGKETFSGKEMHIREGVVVRSYRERRHESLGRVILKSVSPEYLVRGGETTEYQ